MQPWQKDIFEKYCTGDVEMTMSVGRQTGKSTLNQLYRKYRNFMERPEKRFQLAGGGTNSIFGYMLMIVDYMWWTENEREILNWMAANLPRGIDHQQGMIITFDTDQDRMMFLLRWA
jgi:hypothetical protein